MKKLALASGAALLAVAYCQQGTLQACSREAPGVLTVPDGKRLGFCA